MVQTVYTSNSKNPVGPFFAVRGRIIRKKEVITIKNYIVAGNTKRSAVSLTRTVDQ